MNKIKGINIYVCFIILITQLSYAFSKYQCSYPKKKYINIYSKPFFYNLHIPTVKHFILRRS